MKCWFCEKETMEEAPDLGSGWFRCSKDGATWIKVSKPYQVVGEEVIVFSDYDKIKHIKARRTGRKAKK